jgi:mRNA-degrading endonuclease RelE of RelBE toxin-antitoxin system
MQIIDKNVEFSRRAEIALNRLSEQDRNRVLKNIEKVFALGLKPPFAAKLKGIKNTFLVRAGRDLRIIFLVETEFVRIIDIVRHDKLKQISLTNRSQGGDS